MALLMGKIICNLITVAVNSHTASNTLKTVLLADACDCDKINGNNEIQCIWFVHTCRRI